MNKEKSALIKGETLLQQLFGRNVRVKRLQLKLSQEQLAERAELHFSYISSIERGQRNVSLANIYKIAKALNCPMSEIIPPLE